MSANGTNVCEDAEMAECDGEKVVTMMDVLKEQEDFEDDANAVLGASDDKNCTYSKGYIKRQAIYACLTCLDVKNDPTKWAGVCLACSLTCHENHDLIELYTKRNFRCDCGNPKFNSHPCQFTPNKTDLNGENVYNQNFIGVYCVCHRPYPDPDAAIEEEMIQCIICEDWLHSNHLDTVVPANDLYTEMVCKACMEKNQFLHDYSELAVNKNNTDIDILNTNSELNGSLKVDDTLVDEGVKSNSDVNIIGNTDEKEKTGDKPEPAQEQTSDELFPKQENQINTNTSESIANTETQDSAEIIDSTTKLLSLDTNDAVTESLNETNSKADEKNENKTMEVQRSTEEAKTTDGTQSDSTEKESVQTENKVTPNDHSKEESQEDPIESKTGQLKEVANTDAVSEEKPNSEAMDTSESESIAKDQVKKMENSEIIQSSSVGGSVPKQSAVESTSSAEQSENTLIAEQSETTNKSENAASENKPTTEPGCTDIQSGNEGNTAKSDAQVAEEKENSIDVEINENNSNDKQNELKNYNNLQDKPDILKRKLSTDSEISEAKKAKKDDMKCVRLRGQQIVHYGATFWPSNFRHKLCTCNECITMYKDLSVLFLIDPEDTVTAYEKLGKEKSDGKPVSQYEKGMAALSSLGRVQQINALTEYAKLRDKLVDFLRSFKDRKAVVKEEDIKAFFAGMKTVREPDGVYFCK